MALMERNKLAAKARTLGIDGYRRMSVDQLTAAIAKASKPATKGKTTAKVSTTPAKGKTVAKGKTTTAKGKTTTAPAAKSVARKSTPRASAAKGKATRQSSTTRKPAVAKAPVKRTVAKPVAANGTRRAPISKDKGTRLFLDKKAINWKAPTTVGQSGKRKEVLDALIRFKGNYEKVYDLLAPNWKRYYPSHSKVAAQKLLRWLIARVAFDFAVNTDQHEMGARRAYGTANGHAAKPVARKAVAKATGRKPAAKPAARKAPATRAKAAPAARKPAAARTAAPKGKRGGKVTAGRR